MLLGSGVPNMDTINLCEKVRHVAALAQADDPLGDHTELLLNLALGRRLWRFPALTRP